MKIKELPTNTLLDGRRIRFKGVPLGYIKSAWNRGLWLTKTPTSQAVEPWFPPGESLAAIADDLEVEMKKL